MGKVAEDTPKTSVTLEKLRKETLSVLEGARARLVQERLSEMPKSSMRAYLLAVSGRSLRAAVKAFCAECVCWERDEVRRCTGTDCPLWAVRPFQRKRRKGTDDATGQTKID